MCVLHSLFIISLRFNSLEAVGVVGKCNLVKSQSHSMEKQTKASKGEGDENGQGTEAETRAMKYLETIASGKTYATL